MTARVIYLIGELVDALCLLGVLGVVAVIRTARELVTRRKDRLKKRIRGFNWLLGAMALGIHNFSIIINIILNL